MASINPYLNFMGNTEEAFEFYRSVFGGEFAFIQRFGDTPQVQVRDNEKNMIMHIALPIGKHNMIMGTDALESMGQKLNKGDNFSISVSADTKEEADKIFSGLSKGGSVQMPLEKAFWGDYFGMLTDRFGIQWMVSFRESN